MNSWSMNGYMYDKDGNTLNKDLWVESISGFVASGVFALMFAGQFDYISATITVVGVFLLTGYTVGKIRKTL